jgi:3-hydroxyisobutyrate dehydrogenase-like beta-hydroxyacid dehydrogenase
MLPSSPHVESVFFGGENSLIKGASKDHFFIDASTISQKTSLDVCKRVKTLGAQFIDAPVSGLMLTNLFNRRRNWGASWNFDFYGRRRHRCI